MNTKALVIDGAMNPLAAIANFKLLPFHDKAKVTQKEDSMYTNAMPYSSLWIYSIAWCIQRQNRVWFVNKMLESCLFNLGMPRENKITKIPELFSRQCS